MNQILELIKSKDLYLPRILLTSYRKLNITDLEFIILIYLLNSDNLTYNPKLISSDLNIDKIQVLELINSLIEKNIISVEIVKTNNISCELINLDLLYEKMAFCIINGVDSIKSIKEEVYEKIEKEIGRGLTSTDYETINGWLDIGCSEELIMCAVKEAIYNGKYNINYIDRIIYEWNKKGLKTKEDVEKNKKDFRRVKNQNIELFDYDWLNDNTNS